MGNRTRVHHRGALVITLDAGGWLTVTKAGRTIPIQRVTDESVYRALRAYGVSDVRAQAAARGLITIVVKASK